MQQEEKDRRLLEELADSVDDIAHDHTLEHIKNARKLRSVLLFGDRHATMFTIIARKMNWVLNWMLEHGANVDEPRDSITPVFTAIFSGNLGALAILARHGAKMDGTLERDDTSTTLDIAARLKDYKMFAHLIDLGAADVCQIDRSCFSVPFVSCRIVELCFLAGMDLADKLQWACKAPVAKRKLVRYRFCAAIAQSPDGEHLHEDCKHQVRRAARVCFLKTIGFEVCVGLQALELPTLLLVEILRARLATWPNIPFCLLWDFAALVRHHNEPVEHAVKKRRK